MCGTAGVGSNRLTGGASGKRAVGNAMVTAIAGAKGAGASDVRMPKRRWRRGVPELGNLQHPPPTYTFGLALSEAPQERSGRTSASETEVVESKLVAY